MIDETSSTREILRYLEDFPKSDITALCSYLNNKTDYFVPVYGSKYQLLLGLKGVNREALYGAFETLFDPCSEDEDDEVDSEE